MNFLGETKICQVKFLQSELIKCLGCLVPFKLKLDSVGSFPNSRAKIVWLGINGDLCKLNYVQSQITKVVARLGFRYRDDKFKPHITLARIKNCNNLQENEIFLKDMQVIEKSLLEIKDSLDLPTEEVEMAIQSRRDYRRHPYKRHKK